MNKRAAVQAATDSVIVLTVACAEKGSMLSERAPPACRDWEPPIPSLDICPSPSPMCHHGSDLLRVRHAPLKDYPVLQKWRYPWTNAQYTAPKSVTSILHIHDARRANPAAAIPRSKSFQNAKLLQHCVDSVNSALSLSRPSWDPATRTLRPGARPHAPRREFGISWKYAQGVS